MRGRLLCLMAGAVLTIGIGGARTGAAAGLSARTQTQVPGTGAAGTDYAFPSGAGMLLFHVRPDHVSDFETVVARLAAALDATQDPIRRQQASSWRILKSIESTHDSAIYLFFFDPAVAGAGYDPVKILSESVPTEMQSLYAKLKDSVIRVERMGLTKLR